MQSVGVSTTPAAKRGAGAGRATDRIPWIAPRSVRATLAAIERTDAHEWNFERLRDRTWVWSCGFSSEICDFPVRPSCCHVVSILIHGISTVKRLPAAFYALPSGREPVREWLRALADDDRKIIGEDIKDVEFSWPIGMPVCRALGQGLWEVRSALTQGRIARVLFCLHDGRMVLLHGFIKKTRKTPAAELDLAVKRKKEIT